MVELVGDVRRDVYLLALGIGDEHVQEAAALTRQFAKGVEHGEEVSLLTVHSHGEPDGGGLLADLRTPEEAAARLVGDECLDALDVFRTLHVWHLVGVGLHDVADGGIDRNLPVLARHVRDNHRFSGHQQMVGRVDDRTLRLLGFFGFLSSLACDEASQRGALGGSDVAGERLDGVDVALVPDLDILRSEVVDQHDIGAWRGVDFASLRSHELSVVQSLVVH